MRFLYIFFALCVFSACAEVPRPSSFPSAPQQMMQAAQHWDMLAKDVVLQIKTIAEEQPYLAKEWFYVQDRDQTPFGRAFRDFLITELVNQNLLIASTLENAIHINWKKQPVVHLADRAPLYNEPQTELIIHTTVTKNGINLLRRSDVYYINDEDRYQYYPRPEVPKQKVKKRILVPKSYAVVEE